MKTSNLVLSVAVLLTCSVATASEPFIKCSVENFGNLKKMIDGIKEKCPEASILVTTSPPSVLHRKHKNIYIEKYAEKIIEMAPSEKYAVWNLLDVFGGNKNININSRMGLMARDKVHYSNAGYEKQGELFFDAFIQSYELYKSEK